MDGDGDGKSSSLREAEGRGWREDDEVLSGDWTKSYSSRGAKIWGGVCSDALEAHSLAAVGARHGCDRHGETFGPPPLCRSRSYSSRYKMPLDGAG